MTEEIRIDSWSPATVRCWRVAGIVLLVGGVILSVATGLGARRAEAARRARHRPDTVEVVTTRWLPGRSRSLEVKFRLRRADGGLMSGPHGLRVEWSRLGSLHAWISPVQSLLEGKAVRSGEVTVSLRPGQPPSGSLTLKVEGCTQLPRGRRNWTPAWWPGTIRRSENVELYPLSTQRLVVRMPPSPRNGRHSGSGDR